MNEDPQSASLALQFLLIAVLTLMNAFFASAEMAIISLNKNKMKNLATEGNKKAESILKLLDEPTRFLSTIQVGITLGGFFSSASAATGISDDFGKFLTSLQIPYGSQIAFVLVTIALSYITLVFGELFPKRIALKKAEKIALFAVRPILVVQIITAPFVKLLSLSTNFLLKLTRIERNDMDEKISIEEIRSIIQTGQEQGTINETEKEMINSIISFDNKLAKEVMTPRTEVYMIDLDQPLSEYIDELIGEKYSRVPVYQGDTDNIVGVLYMKDFFESARKVGFENVDIKQVIKPPYFVPERKNIDELFKELQMQKKHLAILIDEYGGFSGIVSIEDLIEEVMGNIQDEYDEDWDDIYKIDSNTYMVNGLISISELNSKLNLNLNEDSEDYDTLGGLIISILGYIPKSKGDHVIEYQNLSFKIEEIKDKRIVKVKIYLN